MADETCFRQGCKHWFQCLKLNQWRNKILWAPARTASIEAPCGDKMLQRAEFEMKVVGIMTCALALLALLLVPATGWGQDKSDTSWHLLTQSYGGTVSLIRNLSKAECEKMRRSVLNLDLLDAEAALMDKAPICPDDNDKAAWTKIQMYGACHPKTGGIMSWGLGMRQTSPGEISSAECFQ
jgi:hypothetical protein